MTSDTYKAYIPRLITFTAILSAMLFAGYYFFYIQNIFKLPKYLIETEKNVTEEYLALLENKMALVGLTKLDPNGVNFSDDRSILLDKLEKTQKDGLNLFESSTNYSYTTTGNEKIDKFIQKEYKNRILKLREDALSIFEAEKSIHKEYKILTELTKKVYEYNPVLDLGLNPQDKKEELTERISSAKKGLGNFAENMNNQKTIDPSSYDSGIREIQVLMSALEEAVKSGEPNNYEEKVNELAVVYSKLKQNLYNGEKEYLASGQRLEIVNDLSNAIYEYIFILDEIKLLKSEFSGKSLFN